MAMKACCLSREAPSPDSVPSRPVDTSEAIPLRPILDKPAMLSWSTFSRFSKPEDAAELEAIFNTDRVENNESPLTHTITAVKSRLRKHLSRESALSKRRSRSTVGQSEEEIARRKELRRLRQKRIQDELGDEGVYDEDAKSIPSNVIKPLSSTPQPNPHVSIPYNIASPTISRRHSFSGVIRHEDSTSEDNQLSLVNSCTLEMPPAPVLKPQKLPSIADTGARRISWRLSFSSDRRASRLRALSQDYRSSVDHSVEIQPSVSKDLKWLRSQGLRIPSQALTDDSEPIYNLEPLGSHTGLCVDHKNFGGVDGNSEPPFAPIPLHQMLISQRLASRGLFNHSSSPELSSIGSAGYQQDNSSGSTGFRQAIAQRSRYFRNSSSSAFTEGRVPPSWGKVLRRSSLYKTEDSKSGMQSEMSSEEEPHMALQSNGVSNDTEAPAVLLILPNTNARIDIVETASQSTSSFTAPFARMSRRQNTDSSLLTPEATSSQDRDGELKGVECQSLRSFGRSSSSIPVTSKFKEDFEEPVPASSSRSSIFSVFHLPRIAKFSSKSYDGSSSNDFLALSIPQIQISEHDFVDCSEQVATPRCSSARLSSPRRSSKSPSVNPNPWQLSTDSTATMWQKAIRRSIDIRPQVRIDSMVPKSPRQQSIYSTTQNSQVSLKGKQLETLSDNEEFDEIAQLQIVTDLGETQNIRDETADRTAQIWNYQLLAQEGEAKRGSDLFNRGLSLNRNVTPPASWARFPSHSREERNESATASDSVVSNDFAVKTLEDGSIEYITSIRKHLHRHHEKDHHHHKSLPVRLSMKIRASLDKLRTSKSTLRHDAIVGRRSSTSIGGVLENPELEILPLMPGSNYLRETQLEVSASMRRAPRQCRRIVSPGSDEGFGFDGESATRVRVVDHQFYNDCVGEFGIKDDRRSAKSFRSETTVERAMPEYFTDRQVSKRSKFKTWSGRERNAFIDSRSVLRQSTIDFTKELEMMEVLERERALSMAEEAFGKKN